MFMVKFMGNKTHPPNSTQKQIAKELDCSHSTIKRHRKDNIKNSPHD